MTECARSPFESSLIPTDYFAAHQTFHDLIEHLVFVFYQVVGDFVALKESSDLRSSVRAPPISVIHTEAAGLTQKRVVSPKRGSECAAAIAGCGLDENLLERRFAHNA